MLSYIFVYGIIQTPMVASIRKRIKFLGISKRSFWLVFSFFLFAPLWFTQAQVKPPPKLDNPITQETLSTFIKSILDIVITIGIPVVALAIIYSGFLFVKARGNPEELQKAKSAFMWTIIGAAILLGSWVFAQAIGETIEQIRTG